MKARGKTKAELVEEVERLQRRIEELEDSEANRKRAEEALVHERNLLRTLMDSLPDYIFIKDRESRFVITNTAHLEVLGSETPDAVVGKTDFEFFPKDLAENYFRDEQEVMQANKPLLNREEEVVDPEGHRMWLLTSKLPVRDATGAVAGLVGISRDITDRKLAEAALQESDERLNLALRSSGVGTWNWDIVANRLVWDDYIHPLFGLEPGTFPGRHEDFLRLIHPDDRDRVRREIADCIEIDSEYDTEFHVIWPEGAVHVLGSRGRVYREDSGRALRMAGVCWDVTERWEAEEALRHSEQMLQAILDNSPTVIFLKDVQGRYLLVNRKFEQLFHIDREHILGKTDREVFPAEMAQTFRENDLRVVASLESMQIEEIAPHDDGPHTYLSMKFPLFDGSGQPHAVCGIATDITERKEAEEALRRAQNELEQRVRDRTVDLEQANERLQAEIVERRQAEEAHRESESRFRNVLENTRDMLYKLNLDTMTYEYISPAAQPVTGFWPEELIAMGYAGIEERIHPEEQEVVARELEEFVEGPPQDNPSTHVEYRWLAKNGDYIWASENRTIIRDDQGFPVAIVGSLRDVTERKQAEREMGRMRQYLQNVIDSMPSVLIGVDTFGRVTHWNKEAARVTGLDAAVAHSRPFDEVMPILAVKADVVLEAILQEHTLLSERLTGETSDGTTRYFDLTVYPLAANGVEAAVIRIDDVTTRFQIEEMMVQTEKMMSVGGLAAGMAHEINNPLGGILHACQNIERRTSLDLEKNRQAAQAVGTTMDTIRAYMEERGILGFIDGIRSDGKRAAKIVADILAFSRRSESRFAPANVDELLDTVLRLAGSDYDLRRQYDFKRVNIIRDLDPNLPEIRCDKTKLEQVLLNLVKNAAQAMATQDDNPDPTITVATRIDGKYARIEVLDNGPGMDDSVRRRVFEPFFTTKEVGIGTGLGLSVSYFIITNQHKGTMAVESLPGAGARFIVRVPLELEED